MLTYSELILLPTFQERLEYLRLDDLSSELAFDNLRYLNQTFYKSREWKDIRARVISRDFGYDLAVPGYNISGKAIVHHMNTLSLKDIYLKTEKAMDPEFLITVSHQTHQLIHFDIQISELSTDRVPGDTRLW
jgi:hypothetical protein